MYDLIPKNKYAWIKNIDQADKVGSLYVPGSTTNQYRMATLLAFDDECSESKGLEVNQTVLYDTIGAVDHRIGNAMYTTVKLLNIIAVVQQKPFVQRDTIPVVDPNTAVG